MINNSISLIKVNDLCERYFFIPSYQRGYKWKPQQVVDLLDDLKEYVDNKEGLDEFYCLQPLVVKLRKLNKGIEIRLDRNATEDDLKRKYEEAMKSFEWEVIDGQQRLTTIKMILTYLGETSYSIIYETREDSENFLDNIGEKGETDAIKNSDYYHMWNVYSKICEWFEGYNDNYKEKFKEAIKQKCQFIWYQCDEDAISVFTRLNIGKISLTNSELIKAMMLSSAHVDTSDVDIKSRQREISNEWNAIEYSLQNDELWLFIHALEFNSPTRIDYLFDIVCKCNMLDLKEGHKAKLGNDKYRTFRYFDFYYSGKYQDKKCNDTSNCWRLVMTLYNTILEWYNDVELYHYVGFVIDRNYESLDSLYVKWKKSNTKADFKAELQTTIGNKIKAIFPKDKDFCIEGLLDMTYEIDDNEEGKSGSSKKKTECYPILLLHNVETAIMQNKASKDADPFKYEVFFRYPFYLMKKDKWDVEHIDSNTPNQLKENYDKLIWLLQYKDRGISELDELLERIKDNIYESSGKSLCEREIKEKLATFNFDDYCKKNGKNNFDSFQNFIIEKVEENLEDVDKSKHLDQSEKNRIWNFVLLDSTTNRSYGNSIFPSKRRTIMAKDRRSICELILEGQEFKFNISYSDKVTAFVPPVTRNVFMKYYTPTTHSFESWDKYDAEKYREQIKKTLEKYIK